MADPHDPNPVSPDPVSPAEGDEFPRPQGRRLANIGEMVRDAVAVLAAILIAFGLDAWWDARVERESMLDALDAVRVEMERNLVSLDSAVAFNGRQAEGLSELASLSEDDLARLSDEDLSGPPGFQIMTLERGAITAFMEGGFLQVVDDVHVRTAIAAASTLQDELDEERDALAAVDDRWRAAVFSALPIGDVDPGQSDLQLRRRQLAIFVNDDRVRRASLELVLFLSLYTEEMERVRERLSAAHEAVTRPGE